MWAGNCKGELTFSGLFSCIPNPKYQSLEVDAWTNTVAVLTVAFNLSSFVKKTSAYLTLMLEMFSNVTRGFLESTWLNKLLQTASSNHKGEFSSPST